MGVIARTSSMAYKQTNRSGLGTLESIVPESRANLK
jgi:hypothetical protein